VAGTLLLMWLEGFARPAWLEQTLPAGGAEWIWADVEAGEDWVAFFAVRDFELPSLPDSRASLVISADEEYVAFLNGKAVGSGAFRQGEALDSYDVTPIIRQGENRLLVELRSSRGIGGFLASLEAGNETIVVSDGSWRVVEEYREDFKWPREPLGETTPVVVWGRSPTGRWGAGGGVNPRPRLLDQLLSRRPLPAALMGAGPEPRKWTRLPADPNREEPLGSWVTFDFGRVVEGYLNVVTANRGGGKGLYWIGTETPPDPRSGRPTGNLVLMVGQGSWTDAVPRTFRFVTVVSLAEIAGARAFVLEPDLAPALLREDLQPKGVLGLQPPDLRPPVEDEFWREFERQASLAGGEDL
jgi:hypothetical protein